MGNLPRKHSQQRQTLVLTLSTSAGQDEPGGAAGTTNPSPQNPTPTPTPVSNGLTPGKSGFVQPSALLATSDGPQDHHTQEGGREVTVALKLRSGTLLLCSQPIGQS